MIPITDIQEAIGRISVFQGEPDGFELPIDHGLLDPAGINLSLVVDAALAREWEPAGFEQRDGYRVYRFKSMS